MVGGAPGWSQAYSTALARSRTMHQTAPCLFIAFFLLPVDFATNEDLCQTWLLLGQVLSV
jgi:hypothetical protein